MGSNLDTDICKIIEIEFADEFKDLEKDNNKILDKDKLIKKIVSLSREDVIYFILLRLYFKFTLKSEDFGCLSLILLNNPKDKYYYIEILSKVLEELKKKKFYEKFKKMTEEDKKNINEKLEKFSEKIKKKKEKRNYLFKKV